MIGIPGRVLRHVLVAAALLTLTAQAARALDHVTYLLPAPTALPATAPWMIALHKGYYRAAGLDVDFEIAKGGVDVAKEVGVGNAMIGGAIGDTPIIVRANGVPVKAVAVLGGGSLMQLVVNADSGILSPADLKGKTVTVMSYQDTTFYALLGVLAKVGLNRNEVNIQAVGPANVWKLFLAKKADAMAAVPDWIGNVTAAGAHVRIFPATAYFPSMAQAIVASDRSIKKSPGEIRRLVQATLHGMKDIMDDPKAAAAAYIAAVPQHAGQEAVITTIFKLYNKYVYAGQKVLGAMNAKRLATLERFYLKAGIIERAVPVRELYTNAFVLPAH